MASYVEIIRLFLSSQTLDFRKNTPAYAGNTSDPSSTIPVFRDHPRLRGEYPDGQPAITSSLGSPPLARGIRFKREIFSPSIRITPACAGNTLQSFPFSFVCEDHPRLRGEYNHLTACIYHPQGSPPLARGIPQPSICVLSGRRITPACAGNTLKKSLIYNLFPISISKFHLVSQTPEML